MPQSGSIQAPQSRAALDALIAQRNELQGQLRSSEDRRFQLTEQRASMQDLRGAQTAEVDRRIKTLDATIDRLERQIATANELISAGHARLGGARSELLPPNIEIPIPPIPPVPAVPPWPADVSFTEAPSSAPGAPVGRLLVLEGVGFLLLFAVAWVWMTRRFERRLAQRSATDPGQMTQLQQSVDAIALEVERISENQRWVTKQVNERGLGAGEAQPARASQPEPVRRER